MLLYSYDKPLMLYDKPLMLYDKPLMLRNQKSVRRWGNYQTLNHLLFERNLVKNYEDTVKKTSSE